MFADLLLQRVAPPSPEGFVFRRCCISTSNRKSATIYRPPSGIREGGTLPPDKTLNTSPFKSLSSHLSCFSTDPPFWIPPFRRVRRPKQRPASLLNIMRVCVHIYIYIYIYIHTSSTTTTTTTTNDNNNDNSTNHNITNKHNNKQTKIMIMTIIT